MNRFSQKISLLLALLAFTFSYCRSQGIAEEFQTNITRAPIMRAMDIQHDGKIILSGDMTSVGLQDARYLARINPDGSLDESFQPPLFSDEYFGFFSIKASEAAEDSVILLRAFNGRDMVVVKRDGSIEETYQEHSTIISPYGIGFYKDKYLIAETGTGQHLYMVNRDGTLADGFTTGNMVANTLFFEFLIQPDDKILVYGAIKEYNEVAQGGLVRVNPDGSLDESFNAGTGPTGSNALIRDAVLQEDGKIVLAGDFTEFNGTPAPGGLIRLNSDGTIDETFVNTPVANITQRLTQIEETSDKKLLVASADKVLRLNADGTIDGSFETKNVISFFGGTQSLKLGSEGQIYGTGGFTGIDGQRALSFYELDPNGNLMDTHPQLGKPAYVTNAAVQDDGKVVIVGDVMAVGADIVHGIARLNPDGTLDKTFDLGLDFAASISATYSSVALQPDGKVLVGGNFPGQFGNTSGSLFRFNTDGTLDDTFLARVSGIFSAQGVSNIYVDDENTILIAGSINYANGEVRNGIAKFNADGSLITTFNSNNLFNSRDRIQALRVLEDGGFFLGGYIQDDNEYFVRKFKSDGSIDESFNGYTGNTFTIHDIADINGTIVAGGRSQVGGSVNNTVTLTQFSQSGEVIDETSIGISETTQNNMASFFHFIDLGDNEMLMLGDFLKVNGVELPSIAKINLNGQIDQSFRFDINNSVFEVTEYDEDHILIFGSFTTINGKSHVGAAKIRITNIPPTITGLVTDLSTNEDEAIEIKLEDLSIEDSDDEAADITIAEVGEGDNYTVENNTITPAMDFNGTLTVPVKVTDGKSESPVFEVMIDVLPVNDAPIVSGTSSDLSTAEETALTIVLNDLNVTDVDNTFPDGFTFTVSEGDNYSVDGTTITPTTDFNGALTVGITVNDGDADSEMANITITVTPVNDAPVITAQTATFLIDNETSLEILPSALEVSDVDNTYPTDFTLSLSAGSNYTVDGNTITPTSGFIGDLSIPVTANDGTDDSEPFNLQVEVTPVLSLEPNINFEGKITIGPNPASDRIKVKVENEVYETLQLRIMNTSGGEVFKGSFPKISTLFEQEILTGQYKSGLYIVEITQGAKSRATLKFIKD